MQTRNELIEGPIVKKLVGFFLPIAAGTLFQQLYNAVDAFVVGKFVGTEALAAVGGSPAILINLIIGFFVPRLSQKGAQTMTDFLEAGYELTMKVTGWILRFAPLGIFAVVAVHLSYQKSKAPLKYSICSFVYWNACSQPSSVSSKLYAPK